MLTSLCEDKNTGASTENHTFGEGSLSMFPAKTLEDVYTVEKNLKIKTISHKG